MSSRIFISHAGCESDQAVRVARALETAGLEVLLDRSMIQTGDSFLQFMEKSLTVSDFCLLLWSKAAAQREWVQLEWEAALYRTVTEARSFLVVGRLDTYPLPSLLAPRLTVDLHPDIHPGIDRLIRMWKDHNVIEKRTGQPVGHVAGLSDSMERGENVYLASDFFDVTVPILADLHAPAGLLLDRLFQVLDLPSDYDHNGLLGVRFQYRLLHEEQVVDRAKTLAAQGVRPGDVLWIEFDMVTYAYRESKYNTLQKATFRGTRERGVVSDAVQAAEKLLLLRLRDSNLV